MLLHLVVASLSLSKENKKTNYKEQQHFIHRRSKEFFLGRMAAIWHDWFVNFKLLLGFKIFKLSFGVFQMQNIRPEDCHALRGGCRRFCMNFKDFKDSRIRGCRQENGQPDSCKSKTIILEQKFTSWDEKEKVSSFQILVRVS